MSIDKSLRRRNQLARARSVLKRDERIKTLMETERWTDGRSPFALPKVRVAKVAVKKKVAKEKTDEAAAGATPAEGAAAAPAKGGAAPAKGAGAAPAKGGDKAPAKK
jgi:small basic protein (TIGR04137 family)